MSKKWDYSAIKKEHVFSAAEYWDKKNTYSPFKNSILYDVEINNKLYPPKPIISKAFFLATRHELSPEDFGGAAAGPWHKQLKELGFTIHNKKTNQNNKKNYFEGNMSKVLNNVYERDKNARKACIAHHGASCQVCGFDFGKIYGKAGEGFIHVHHETPISSKKKQHKVDPKNDLFPVCPNCHAMIHLSGKLKIIDFKEYLKSKPIKNNKK